MKREIRTQRIIIDSSKDALTPYVANLKKVKEIYDKLVEFFSMRIAREFISLRIKLYKMKISREKVITLYFMKVFEIRDQLQELREGMFDQDMSAIVLNALPDE